MRTASAPFETYLETTNEFIIADLYTLTLKSGEVLRLTSWDVPLTVLGNLYTSAAGYIKRSRIKQTIGVDVDECNITLDANFSQTLADGTPILVAISNGRFRGAAVRVDRLYMQTAGIVTFDPILWFVGNVGPVDADSLSATLIARSALYILDVKLPRNLMQPSCRRTLFDADCTVVKASFGIARVVDAATTSLRVVSTVVPSQPDGYFTLGTLTFTSGANTGISRTIRQHVGANYYLHTPLPFVVNAGDAFSTYAGCDKSTATCDTKFANSANFDGEPFVPPPETAI